METEIDKRIIIYDMRPNLNGEVQNYFRQSAAVTAAVISLAACAGDREPQSAQTLPDQAVVTVPIDTLAPPEPLPTVTRLPQSALPSVEPVGNESLTDVPQAQPRTANPAASGPDCSIRPIAPNYYFNKANTGKLEQQMTLLEDLWQGKKVRLVDVYTGIGIVKQAIVDPDESEAVDRIIPQIKRDDKIVRAKDLFELKPPVSHDPKELCGRYRQTDKAAKAQAREIRNVSKFVGKHMTRNLGRSAAIGAKTLWETLNEDLQRKVKQIQESP